MDVSLTLEMAIYVLKSAVWTEKFQFKVGLFSCLFEMTKTPKLKLTCITFAAHVLNAKVVEKKTDLVRFVLK